ncbi:hypothetical protein [Candidatus Uabimicrobium amorphum]|uniref:Uncharacterized protein n=1 Tax=Uabimicrobium amorphum TaxID=2596890 RepID=A0A5S9IMF5_UABAM|nr:hypothetical protein [Candidatus Uabimicrobium amorphum]BBM84593.1 hypothetical protein UABAM_02954 [Candidatus Uabimicrobium amorphum]
MRSKKNSRKIVVDDIEYRWRAKGGPGSISVGIWPANDIGPYMMAIFGYDETFVRRPDGYITSNGDQIVITNKIVKRVIDCARQKYGYDPNTKGKQLCLSGDEVEWRDAVRSSSNYL